MESLQSNEETFFEGLANIGDTFFSSELKSDDGNKENSFSMRSLGSKEKIWEEEEENNTVITSKKTPQQEKSPMPKTNKTLQVVRNSEKIEKKPKRTPLKTLNFNPSVVDGGKVTKAKSPKVTKKSPGEKKAGKKEPKNSVKKERKSVKAEKEKKTVVYEDSPFTKAKNPMGRRVNFRASLPENNQPTVIILPRNRKFRYSLDELQREKLENEKKHQNESIFPMGVGFDTGKGKPLSKPTPTAEDIEKCVEKLETMFPNVDPEYLKAQFIKLKWSLHDTIEILLPKEKTGELPTREEYVRRKETEKLHNKYWENFTIEKYLKLIPDPWQYFLEAEKHNSHKYANHSFHFLKNKFKKHYSQVLQEVFIRNGFSLYLTCQELKRKNRTLKMRATNRSKAECEAGKPNTFEIQFLHEVALIEYEPQIKAYLKKEEALKLKRYQAAEKNGELYQCMTCKDYLLPVDDVISCSTNHIFCVDCVVRLVKVEIKGDDFEFKCLKVCKQKFSKYLLEEKLGPLLMATTIRRIQAETFKPTGIENLLSCPFCYHLMILPPEIATLQCLNPECMLESCRIVENLTEAEYECFRYCKQPSQTHSKCTQLEKLELDKTEENPIDLSLKCLYCHKEFNGEYESVQITCSCGAVFCSICRKPFPECEHLLDKDFEAFTECDISTLEYNSILDNYKNTAIDDYNNNNEPISINIGDYDYEDLDTTPTNTGPVKYLSSDEEFVEASDSIHF